MNIAVTGACGWLGGHTSNLLERIGHKVYRIDKPSLRSDKVIGWNIRNAVECDLPSVDAVYHFAAAADVNQINNRPIISVLDNVLGTGRVLEWVREKKIPKFFYISSAWSNAWPGNAHPYTATKLMGEMLCESWGRQYGTPWTIIRLGTAYGPGGRSGTAITNFVAKAIAGEPISIFGKGEASRRYIYIDDLAMGCAKAVDAECSQMVLDVCGASDVTVEELARIVIANVSTVPITYLPERPGDLDAEYAPAYERTTQILKWSPQTAIDVGVKQYAKWILSQLDNMEAPWPK